MMSDKSKTYQVILILLFLALNTSAQKSSMVVYKAKEVIFKKEVAEIDSVKFYKTGIVPSLKKETMFVYRYGIIEFQKYIYDIDSVTFSKDTQNPPLLLAGTLDPVVVPGCSFNSAPVAVATVTALEQLPGSVTINEGCSGEAYLTVTSEDFPDGSCPIVINRIYTVKDDCNNVATVSQQITVQDTTPPIVSGTLTAVTIPGCSAASAPAPVTTVAALEQLAGAITIHDECTSKANLTLSSTEVSGGICPITVTRTYTIMDVCKNSVQVVQQITLAPEDQHIANAVLIPCGSFTMGSPNSEIKWPSDDLKRDETQHEVTLSAFYMSKYEVTNSEFAKFLNDKQIGADGIYQGKALLNYDASWVEDWGVRFFGGKWIPWTGYENHPVVFETWYGAVEYAHYVGGRLPTEAEWEYACRAGTYTPFSLGTGYCLSDSQANYDYRDPYDGCAYSPFIEWHTEPVNSYAPNAWGLHNMHGNVGEWCSDWYGPYPSDAQINPTGSTTGSKRVIRGGGNTNVAHRLRSAYRGSVEPEYGSSTTGFRVAFSCTASN